MELQLYREYLLERAEYYHALEKVASFRPGESYSSLKKTVVIFICNFDFFGLNEGRYVYKSGLVDHPELNFESHSTTIFSNTMKKTPRYPGNLLPGGIGDLFSIILIEYVLLKCFFTHISDRSDIIA